MKPLHILVLIMSISFLGTSCTKKKKGSVPAPSKPQTVVSKIDRPLIDPRIVVEEKKTTEDDIWLLEDLQIDKESGDDETTVIVTTKSDKVTTTTNNENKPTTTCVKTIEENTLTQKEGVVTKTSKTSTLTENADGRKATITIDGETTEHDLFVKNDMSQVRAEEILELKENKEIRKEEREQLKTDNQAALDAAETKKERKEIKRENREKVIDKAVEDFDASIHDLVESAKDIATERKENKAYDKATDFAEENLDQNEIEAEVFATQFIENINDEQNKLKAFKKYKKIFKFATRSNSLFNLRLGLEMTNIDGKEFADKMIKNELLFDVDLLEIYEKAFRKALKEELPREEAMAEAEKACDKIISDEANKEEENNEIEPDLENW